MKINNWTECIQGHVKWKEVDEEDKTFKQWVVPDGEEEEKAVLDWLAQQPKDSFSRGINVLVEGWRRCVECSRDYI
jgi:hypothetical protein